MNAISKGQRPLKIDIWTDFLCPFCYLTTLRVQRLAQVMPVELTARALMLRPPAAPPLPEDFCGKGLSQMSQFKGLGRLRDRSRYDQAHHLSGHRVSD
ncbi:MULTISPECIES: DsbA family protein [Cupriavidus]|uniref:DSBA-like thioredoxin domain-containing protein n=1 Tax=Cupriavidus oxalaticus TaxID=96344 RepID=A0A4P7L4F8_9BURK|nr:MULTISPECIES: DsbA family protein [Cupriavidus]MBF6986167.1 DsbA family protein [Cupriavidus sp. IK-TO18]QBY50324.1 hypothetical protein E0W60_03685 [Cupriavidus oxalaticus]